MDNAQESTVAPSLGVHPGILVPATFPPFDRYVLERDGGGFRLFQRADEPVYANIFDRLEKAGAEMVYLCGKDRGACLDYVEEHLAHLTEEASLPSGQAAEWVYHLACRAMEELLEEPDSTERYARLEGLVDAITQAAMRDPGGQWRMLECAPLKHKTNSHSINVAVLLTGFARTVLRVSDRKVLTEVAIGGALHDLGKTRVPLAILDKPAALTRTEFAEVKKHPKYGLDIAKPYLHKGSIARHIIAQHHENVSGNGYPDGRAGESIDLFARVARVVDVFDALTSHRPYSDAIDTFSALNQMVVEMRPQFDMPILRKFIRYLSADWDHDPPAAVAAVPAEPTVESLPALLTGPPLDAEKVAEEEEPAAAEEPAPEPVAAEAPEDDYVVEPFPADEATVQFALPGTPAAEARRAAAHRAEEPMVVTVRRHIEAVPLLDPASIRQEFPAPERPRPPLPRTGGAVPAAHTDGRAGRPGRAAGEDPGDVRLAGRHQRPDGRHHARPQRGRRRPASARRRDGPTSARPAGSALAAARAIGRRGGTPALPARLGGRRVAPHLRRRRGRQPAVLPHAGGDADLPERRAPERRRGPAGLPRQRHRDGRQLRPRPAHRRRPHPDHRRQ